MSEHFDSIPDECKTGRYRADGPAWIGGGGVPDPQHRATRPRRRLYRVLYGGADIVTAMLMSAVAAALVLLLAAWFGLIP